MPAAAFWAAFVVTRPLGTGLGVWLAASAGGADMSRWLVSAILTVLVIGVIGLVGYEY